MIRILIADDEELERRALRYIIDSSEFGAHVQIEEASNGNEALEKGRAERYDAFFLDVKMPGLDGLGAAEALRGAGVLSPIVILSAFDTFEYAQKAIRLGVYEYLLKPASSEEVISALRRSLDAGREVESLARRRQESLQAIDEARLRISRTFTSQIVSGNMESATAAEFEKVWELETAPRSALVCRLSGADRRSSAGQASDDPTGASPGTLGLAAALLDAARIAAERVAGESGCRLSGGLGGDALSFVLYGGICPEGNGHRRSGTEPLKPYVDAMREALRSLASVEPLFGVAGPSLDDAALLLERAAEGARLASISSTLVRLEPLVRADAPETLRFSSRVRAPRTAGLRALEYIQREYAHDFSLSDVAATLAVSPFHLSRAISRELGIGFSELLNRVRINKAKEILLGGGSVKEASYLVGFSDQAYFTRVFRKFEGTTPRGFLDSTAKKYKR